MTKLTYPIIVLSALLSACDSGSSSSDSSTNAAAPSAPAAVSLPVDQTGKADGLDFTVTDVATPNQVGPAGVGLKAETGETFVVVSYTIKNTSGKALPLMERPGLSLIDANGQSYAPDDMAGVMSATTMSDPSGMAADLNPNVSAKSKAAWKIDKAAFDKAAWKLVVNSDPQLTFALK